MLHAFDPMLPTLGPLPQDGERWSLEPQWDGFRTIVVARQGREVVWSRNGNGNGNGLTDPLG